MREKNHRRIRCGKPGEIIQVSPPDFVNFVIVVDRMLPLQPMPSKASDGTTRFRYVMPCPFWNQKAVVDSFSNLGIPLHRSHSYELGFAFTFHKVQGATLERAIIDLNFGSRSCRFPSIYVGLSRVRRQHDMLLLPMAPAAQCRVQDAQWSPDLRVWMEKHRKKTVEATKLAAAEAKVQPAATVAAAPATSRQ